MKKRQAISINRAGQPWDTPGHLCFDGWGWMAGTRPTRFTHLGNDCKIRGLPDGQGRSYIVMARLVRATYRGTSG